MADPPPHRWQSGAQAPARERLRPTVRERVAEIEARMRAGTWTTAQASELAELWGMSVAGVQRHSSEASRRILAGTPAEAQAKAEAVLEWAEELVPYAKDPASAAVKVAMGWQRLYGLGRPASPPSKPLPGADGADEPFGFTKDEKP